MQSIFELKEQTVTETPLLLFDCQFVDGRKEFWSTHAVTVEGQPYEARVLRHNLFEIQAASDQGIDGAPRIALTVANADSHFSQIERSSGFRGAKLSVRFLFYDLRGAKAASEEEVVFQGICNPPEEITESTFRLSASNRMSMQRILLPQVRIQRRCPWTFPATREQREEAVDGGSAGKYSRFFRCGYSADVPGGAGALNGDTPYASCGFTKDDCRARGMLVHFGGLGFVPSSIQVRSYGDKASHTSAIQENVARYNDFVPMVYGTGWYQPPVVFARNDGNLTHFEVLLGVGEIQGVLKVLVNDVEIPPGQAGTNMTGTGWYNVPTLGTRSGGFNLDFVSADGTPAGDPYGSMAYLAVVVPNRLNDGGSLPRVKVLLQGLKLPIYDAEGSLVAEEFTNNPAWVLLDLMRRSGWSLDELDIRSFAAAADCCDEPVSTKDLNGNAIATPRFQCNLVVQKRRSAGDLVRGIRNGSRLYLTYSPSGMVRLLAEEALAVQQSIKPTNSNATTSVNNGWPAYEFGDGTYGLSGILRRDNGEPSIRVWCRSSSDTANRLTLEFQDALNEYQQDSLALADADDIARVGQEITAPVSVLGIPNYDQAARILKFTLDKSLQGNLYVDFETSVRCVGLKPGDLITITYLKEGFDRTVFRVLKIAPSLNYATARITAQIHSDSWYLDENGQTNPTPGGREYDRGIGVPRPLGGSVWDADGTPQYGVEETRKIGGDGSASVALAVSFLAAKAPAVNGLPAPLLDLSAAILEGGSLRGGQTLFYGISAIDQGEAEGHMSFLVRARLETDTGHSVRLSGLSFPKGTRSFNVYRGSSPAQVYRIASNIGVDNQFIDDGLASGLIPPPDANFDHANFYWRSELVPEVQATLHSASSIGNSVLEMRDNAYQGASARITKGTGAGQERTIIANTQTTVAVSPAWDIVPDATSSFSIAEGGWRFGSKTVSSPVHFDVPDQAGETIQICGRAANAFDVECALELSTITRWKVDENSAADSNVPPAPIYGVGPGPRGGTLELSGVSFSDLANTRRISAGTVTVHYWDELGSAPSVMLQTPVGLEDTLLELKSPGSAQPGSLIQVDREVMQVSKVKSSTLYDVVRGALTSPAAAHGVDAAVYPLDRKTLVIPFAPDFFGSPYSSNWAYPISLPNVRVAGLELFLTNAFGNGPAGELPLTHLENYGLRTLSGGQYCLQVDGFLAVQDSIAPPLVVDAPHAIQDIFAVLGTAADGPVQVQVKLNGDLLGTVTVPAGLTVSNSVPGFGLPGLAAGAILSAAIVSVGQIYPGADLTVVVRL